MTRLIEDRNAANWLSLPIDYDDVESYSHWRGKNPDLPGTQWEAHAWELRKRFRHIEEDDDTAEGFYLFLGTVRWDAPDCTGYVCEIWDEADREAPGPNDEPLINAMYWAHKAGWAPSPSLRRVFLDIEHEESEPIASAAHDNAIRRKYLAALETARSLQAQWNEREPIPQPVRDVIDGKLWPKDAEGAGLFLEWVEAHTHADSWDKEMAELFENARVRGIGLQEEVMESLSANRTDYARDIRGHIEPNNINNVEFFLRAQGCEVRWNAWLERPEICGEEWNDWTRVTDDVVAKLRMRASRTATRFCPSKDFFWDAMMSLAYGNRIDPARLRLDELESAWDGRPRLARWLARCCGTPDDEYHQAVGKNVIGGMVRRMREPGCKHDTMAVFSGEQGAGKSTLAQILSLHPDWFIDGVQLGIEAKELLPLLRGRAVVEISEMRTRGESDAVKAMISRQTDTARVAYGREPIERPRRNIFIGTTNHPEMLEDATGGRRFLPVEVIGEIDLEWLRSNVGQLVGEACTLHSAGERFDLPRTAWAGAKERQEAARSKSDYELVLEELMAEERGPLVISAADLVLLVKNSIGRAVNPKLYAPTMRTLGFARHSHRMHGVTVKVWRRGPAELAKRLPQMPSNRLT